MKLHTRPVIVIGMQRSGTSAVSGALERLGVYFGDPARLYGADANNAQGYFEHRKATILNLRCLDAFQMHPTSLGRMPPDWTEHPESASLRAELKDLVKDEFSGGGRWGIKQPLTSLVLPLYLHVFSEMGIQPRFALCVRNPIEVMESEARLDFGAAYRVMQPLGRQAIGSWLRYTLGSYGDVQLHPVTVLMHDELLERPEAQLRRIVATDADWEVSQDQWELAVGSIRSDLRHNRRTLDELDAYPRMVKEAFLALARDSTGDPGAVREILGLHAEFEKWLRLVGEPGPPKGKLGLAWTDSGNRRVAECSFLPTGSWQSLSLDLNAPPKTTLTGILYAPPSRIWIRRAEWLTHGSAVPATLRTGLASVLSKVNGVLRLEAAFEPAQLTLVTPGGGGPYELQIEFLLERSPAISSEISANLARRLDHCAAEVEMLARRVGRRGR